MTKRMRTQSGGDFVIVSDGSFRYIVRQVLYEDAKGVEAFKNLLTSGVAAMPSDYTVEEFIIHGDPAFNPYEPNHG